MTPSSSGTPPAGHATAERRLVNAQTGREYSLRLWRPLAADPARPLATLLMLDGHWLAPVVDAELPALPAAELQVATLGYTETERKTIAPWRTYDYTPYGPDGCRQDARTPQWPCGGAYATLDFIRRNVLPSLADGFPASPEKTELFGHSYAGLFSLHCLLEAPGLFRRIHAASPSLWWYWPHMLSRIPPALGDGMPSVHLMVGGEERLRLQPAVPGQPREPGVSTIPYAQQFVNALTAAGHTHASLQVFPGEEHGPMLTRAARHVLAGFAQSD